MKVCHTLICFFLLFSLQDGNTGLVSAQHTVYSGIEGENVRVQCSFPSDRNRKFFCKETCEQKKDILIETYGAPAQSGRYRIDYKQKDLFVTITQLTKSDSGGYWCGVGSSLSTVSYEYIEIIVVDAKLVGDPSAEKTINARTRGSIVVVCSFTRSVTEIFFCKEECERDILVGTIYNILKKGRYSIRYLETSIKGFVIVSIEQLTQSDSGWYRCGLDRPDSNDLYQRFRLIVTDALTTSTPSSSVPSASTETSNQSESSTSSPASPKTTEQPESTTTGLILYVSLTLVVLVIVSSLSVLVFCRKRICKAKSEEPEPRVETQNASAPDAEDDPSQPAYSEIQFVNVGSSQSGFHSDTERVIYSVPRVEASSVEPPLYSTVNNPQ
ncbi:polymeric immunoglobulin receptor-like isoform X2 [Trematomus bernacchii]|uniref:polymeric immunoglobulin receptor-like isoform X2 n=1 Tax=Trematomus bernacchii TaxID=40690 RepID=UPI001469A7E6|nr:polymeric immunoglobulin receptor-like isoform X2 [Trematomus bernacchii]